MQSTVVQIGAFQKPNNNDADTRRRGGGKSQILSQLGNFFWRRFDMYVSDVYWVYGYLDAAQLSMDPWGARNTDEGAALDAENLSKRCLGLELWASGIRTQMFGHLDHWFLQSNSCHNLQKSNYSNILELS